VKLLFIQVIVTSTSQSKAQIKKMLAKYFWNMFSAACSFQLFPLKCKLQISSSLFFSISQENIDFKEKDKKEKTTMKRVLSIQKDQYNLMVFTDEQN
jgi:hypothetical protein